MYICTAFFGVYNKLKYHVWSTVYNGMCDCSKKHARYLDGSWLDHVKDLDMVSFINSVHILHFKNYVRNLHDSFFNLVRTCWILTRIMNPSCMILVPFLYKNLTSFMTIILPMSWKVFFQDLGKNL